MCHGLKYKIIKLSEKIYSRKFSVSRIKRSTYNWQQKHDPQRKNYITFTSQKLKNFAL